ncbi:hypothetical protein GCM10007160_05180 [Litchfieldella qijiaojingensis]|uniref:DUF4123 domain-containing protein n=1 Tax=Litchfieldella qijiaojingensis TaxID=980347 RepID=A0ABQ2YDM0_9GAMM|nr:DUF4123 domain-containing protein [Halomonas qijiaojingensis]GGX80926.1 hypothetical protein GCM10007160_05180 [Halomonas qijiaojingensis]
MPRFTEDRDLETLLPHEMPRWLVLDRLPDTLKRLYELEEAPDCEPLYARTAYADCLEQSPLLVRPGDVQSPLWRTFVEGCGETPLRGVIVAGHASGAEVAAHLRTRLETRFYGNRRGLLRFYDPWIAAYLFSRASRDNRWLGPLQSVIWHGGTFEKRAESGAQWQAFVAMETDHQPHPTTLDSEEMALEPAQEADMENYMIRFPLWQRLAERHGLREDARDNIQRFVIACDEAERLALPHEQWADYLAWRFDAPRATWPEDIFDTPVGGRLTLLGIHEGNKG